MNREYDLKHISFQYLNPQRKEPKEIVFRKTFEVIEKPFVVNIPQPKIKGSRCYRKACHFMWFLWTHGYRKFIPRETMLAYVQNFLGAFRTTVNFWLGHTVYGGGRGALYIKRQQQSFLEKLRFLTPKPDGYILNHELVPLPYHYRENLEDFQEPSERPVAEFQHESSVAMESMSLVSHRQVMSGEACEGATAPIGRDNKQQHSLCERINASKYTYTNDQMATHYGNEASVPWLSPRETAEILERDRKRLAVEDRAYLAFLGNSVKNRGESQ